MKLKSIFRLASAVAVASSAVLGCRHVKHEIWQVGLDERKALAQMAWTMANAGVSESNTVAKAEEIYRATHH